MKIPSRSLNDMSLWSDEKLDRELAFAVNAVNSGHPETMSWLMKIEAEIASRKRTR